MQPISPTNFLDHYHHDKRPKRSNRRIVLILLSLSVVSAVLSSHRLRGQILPPALEKVVNRVEQLTFFRLAGSTDRTLKGEADDRINIVLVGIGGGNHDGALLTDTIMLASVRPSSGQIALLSIPRDMVVPFPSGQWRKINQVHADAELERPGSGIEAIRTKIESLTGQQVPYIVRIDFDGFQKLIDAIGGLTITVDRTLDDPSYPILGQEENPIYANRFEHLVVPKGVQRMDGSLALKFSRSRHALGGEGSDFARAHRQQKIIAALQHELFSLQTLVSPRRISALETLVNEHIAHNLEFWEIARFAQLAEHLQTKTIIHQVLDDSPNSLLVSGRGIDNAYILQPKDGTFEALKRLEANIFSNEELSTPTHQQIPATPIRTKQKTGLEPSIAVFNGTMTEGLGQRVAETIQSKGLRVDTLGNAQVKGYEQTVIYVKRSTLLDSPSVATLQTILGARPTTIIPTWLQSEPEDLIVVVGAKP